MITTAKIDVARFGPWAVVTVASSGIGAEAARQLAANGLSLVLVARREAMLEQVGRELSRRHGIAYRVITADLSTEPGQRSVVAGTADLDVGLLVANAGIGQPGNFLSFEEIDLRRVAQLNGVAYMYLAHAFGRRFAARGKGGILLGSALGADSGVPYNTKEAASKAMVSTLGRCLHYEFKPLGIHVSVLVVTPTETPLIDKMGLRLAKMPMKPMSVGGGLVKRNEAAASKRDRLIEAAVSLAYRQGFRKTTLADIAEESGVPLGNVYYYFRTRDEIGEAILAFRDEQFAAQQVDPRKL